MILGAIGWIIIWGMENKPQSPEMQKEDRKMKIAGWICAIIGVISFIGALSQGDRVIGPCFRFALGIMFLYFAEGTERRELANV